jgi:hypothetical protein
MPLHNGKRILILPTALTSTCVRNPSFHLPFMYAEKESAEESRHSPVTTVKSTNHASSNAITIGSHKNVITTFLAKHVVECKAQCRST